MMHVLLFVTAFGVAFLAAAQVALTGPAPTVEQTEFFESKIRPLFATKCSTCHGEQVQMAGLKLITAEGFLRGADTGPIVVEGGPGASRLIQAVRYEGKIKMPPTGKLSDQEIAALEEWVKMGAPWPNAEASQNALEGSSPQQPDASPQWSEKQLAHWAFQPVSDPVAPVVTQEKWVQTAIDRFILARLEAEGLHPAPPAAKLTLLRRAKFDLQGLPPTKEEINEFLEDDSPQAFARLVDRLLASPRYGEKWGRNWLDVARYAESTGLDSDIKVPNAWKYRDYVIDSFNNDTPYDRFVIEQLAGDLLPPGKPGEVNERGIIATGFLAVGPKPVTQQDVVKLKYDVADEQIDTTSKAFMALTISCARCHDHKFDPIATKDYYSLAAIFASIKNFEELDPSTTRSKVHLEPLVPNDVHQRYKEHQERIQVVRQKIRSITELAMLQHIIMQQGPRLADYMVAAHEVYKKGADLAKVAADWRLDCEVLQAWVDYLKPGGDLRLHLEEWYKADESNLPSVAEKYQERYLARGAEWIDKLQKWQEEIQAWDGTGKFPRRPNLDPSEDRFFSEVTLDARSMDEGAKKVDGPFAVPQKERESLLTDAMQQQVKEWRDQLDLWEKEAPPEPPMAYAVREDEPVEQYIFIRGSHHNLGEPVTRQFPVVLAGEQQAPITTGSGRLELARWLVSPDHPLTSRVMANRIWYWHFGEGLVRTPNNFGLTGEKPAHPDLLDFLAREFVRKGWSVKQMHRLIMLSSTYQTRSDAGDEVWQRDPGNRLWSRFERRRLTAEELRDSLLALDGSLNLAMGGTLVEKLDSYGFENAYLHPDKTKRRTIYLPLYRNKIPSMLTLFDFVDSTASAGDRSRTIIAPQGLYFMNSEFIYQRSRALAEHLLKLNVENDERRVEEAFWAAFGRGAKPEEVQKMLDFMARYPVSQQGAEARLERWQGLWRVLLASSEFSYLN